uniref:Integrase core domain-containing protein n=1 Tax=Amphimedon queenslandica TaxID=400682 RepID=A0A1X7TI96_AMPQE
MEANHILDPLNNRHLYALHYTYIPRINEALYEFQKAWNIHGLSTEKGMPPIKLFTLGIAKLEAAGKISDDFYATVDAEYGTDVNAPVPILEDNIMSNLSISILIYHSYKTLMCFTILVPVELTYIWKF